MIDPVSPAHSPPPPQIALRRAAEQLEGAFLAEMLKSAGLGQAPTGFSGGIGEEQFTSFLIEAQAKAMVQSGGIGLAEMVFASLVGRGDAR